MSFMLTTGLLTMDAERAFARALRARRRAAIGRRLRGERGSCGLAVYDEHAVAHAAARRRRRDRGEIPLYEIRGTTEPGRAKAFDGAFRPARGAARRWQRVWLAEHRGTVLPPISVVPVEDGYAIRDGHHRVSVALARGALTIDARVEAVPA